MAYVEIDRNYQVRAAVVFPNVLADSVSVTPEIRLEEAVGLARAINLDVAYREIVKLREIKPSAYFSRGFVDRVKPLFETEEIELMIVDASLTPIQQRNLEKALKIKVIDRTALILEIFGERAKTKEGRLQVELAHLTYQRSRLVRSWTHLERQRGGAGFLGGPGETQIELDRRIIDDKIVRIRKELEKVKKTRETSTLGTQTHSLSRRCSGRLHQCRQVHFVQLPVFRRRFCRKSAVCHTRPDHAPHQAARRSRSHLVRHRRVHF